MGNERRQVHLRPGRPLWTRRALLRDGGALGAAVAAGGGRVALGARSALAAESETAAAPSSAPGRTEIAIAVAEAPIAPDGGPATTGVLAGGGLPGPEIRVRERDWLRIVLENRLANSPTSIHWHGILVPAGMDGVPDVSNAPIAAGRTYVYEYPIRQSGTYWYHSHFDFQEQQGCYGAFVIEPEHEPVAADRDAVVILGDWLRRSPEQVFAELRGGNPAMAPSGTKPADSAMKMDGIGMKNAPSATPGAMKMDGGADLSDVKYDSFLLNGRGPNDPWTMPVRVGERIRLRLINGGASTYFRVALGGHRLQITHADGLAVEPVTVDHLLMGMGETYDAIVQIAGPGSFTLHAVAQDGSGQAVGVLHTDDAAPEPDRAMPALAGRALAYADLRATAPTTLPPGPVQTFRLPLGGDMARYVWTIGGQAWPKADPLLIRQGQRVQVELPNETRMWHPMHLHGHFFRVLQGAGDRCPLKHTVNVAPGETVKIEFTADNPGNWFFHCHNAYHLEAGMAREFQYLA